MNRGCCDNCGEGYDNEISWVYNTECEICEHPIPSHLIIKNMKTKEEIDVKILTLMDEVNDLQRKQNESVFTLAVASIQEIINCKRNAISMLNWVINDE